MLSKLNGNSISLLKTTKGILSDIYHCATLPKLVPRALPIKEGARLNKVDITLSVVSRCMTVNNDGQKKFN